MFVELYSLELVTELSLSTCWFSYKDFFFFLINDLVEDVVVVFIHFIDHTMMVSVGC